MGPLSSVIDANGEFISTFQKPQLTDEELVAELDSPQPPFEMKNISDLLPRDAQDAYQTAS
eukprot:NODE_8479_length_242_cov_157.284974_g7864_i0.p1 GENE.NODE_8479_length_242_cov_157.284974_g7864_i0~~NODE_8479_length_242_cov_157.284974_g7864_i0.p1  ORF type:complete len:69 (+),score=24.99 NODE_8479_length_242_cov_157.284974_g7864_i0:25-207(+)